jgi:hypothetical protein
VPAICQFKEPQTSLGLSYDFARLLPLPSLLLSISLQLCQPLSVSLQSFLFLVELSFKQFYRMHSCGELGF